MKNYIFVKSDYRIVRLPFTEILYIEGFGEYVRFHMLARKVISLQSMNKLEELLPTESFVRVHRSFIVNIDNINYIQNNMISVGDVSIPISKGKKNSFFAQIMPYEVQEKGEIEVEEEEE
ncbi:MAG: LytR/AlgR family response regulator transcription factor [Bacteroidia bacterium]